MQVLHRWQYSNNYRSNIWHLWAATTSATNLRLPNTDVKIIPIVISRAGSFHVKTLAWIAQFVSFKKEPPVELNFKQLPLTAKRIAMALHVHAQEWLSHISKTSRKILTTKTKTVTNTKPSHWRPMPEDITQLGGEGGGGGRRVRGYGLHGW